MKLTNNFLSFDEDAVSPVVGVILMVAITVILAAVIGTFVLDLGGQVQQNAQAGVTFDENEGVQVDVQLNSVQSADHIYVTASDSSATYSGGAISASANTSTYDSSLNGQYLLTMSNDTSTASPAAEVGGVGTTVTVRTSSSADGTISVIGVLDGSENIIQTYEYTGGA